MAKKKGRNTRTKVHVATALQNLSTKQQLDREKIAKAEKAIDEALERKQLVRLPVPKDGACLVCGSDSPLIIQFLCKQPCDFLFLV
tara:strand:- start:1205 stop:1462 length:258 start_codon:yes stop_codon:yes gene_type:complete